MTISWLLYSSVALKACTQSTFESKFGFAGLVALKVSFGFAGLVALKASFGFAGLVALGLQAWWR